MMTKRREDFGLSHCHPMEREAEHRCASEYARTKAPWLAKRLVAANMRLVVTIARRYRRPFCDMSDLVQEGNLGLIHAVVRYDPDRGVKLCSYAAWWIRAYILKFTLDNWRLVKTGTSSAQRRLFFNLRKERNQLESRGIDPDADKLAVILDVQEKDVSHMLERFAASDLSLDAPRTVMGEHSGKLLDDLGDVAASQPDVQVEAWDFNHRLRDRLKAVEETLTGRDLVIFRRRLFCEDPVTLAELAREFGVSRERVRQIEHELKGALRCDLERHMGDAIPPAGVRGRPRAGDQQGVPGERFRRALRRAPTPERVLANRFPSAAAA